MVDTCPLKPGPAQDWVGCGERQVTVARSSSQVPVSLGLNMVVLSGPKCFLCSASSKCCFGDGRVWAGGVGKNAREVEPKAIVPFFKITLTNLVSVDERLVYTPHPENPEMYVVSPWH